MTTVRRLRFEIPEIAFLVEALTEYEKKLLELLREQEELDKQEDTLKAQWLRTGELEPYKEWKALNSVNLKLILVNNHTRLVACQVLIRRLKAATIGKKLHSANVDRFYLRLDIIEKELRLPKYIRNSLS